MGQKEAKPPPPPPPINLHLHFPEEKIKELLMKQKGIVNLESNEANSALNECRGIGLLKEANSLSNECRGMGPVKEVNSLSTEGRGMGPVGEENSLVNKSETARTPDETSDKSLTAMALPDEVSGKSLTARILPDVNIPEWTGDSVHGPSKSIVPSSIQDLDAMVAKATKAKQDNCAQTTKSNKSPAPSTITDLSALFDRVKVGKQDAFFPPSNSHTPSAPSTIRDFDALFDRAKGDKQKQVHRSLLNVSEIDAKDKKNDGKGESLTQLPHKESDNLETANTKSPTKNPVPLQPLILVSAPTTSRKPDANKISKAQPSTKPKKQASVLLSEQTRPKVSQITKKPELKKGDSSFGSPPSRQKAVPADPLPENKTIVQPLLSTKCRPESPKKQLKQPKPIAQTPSDQLKSTFKPDKPSQLPKDGPPAPENESVPQPNSSKDARKTEEPHISTLDAHGKEEADNRVWQKTESQKKWISESEYKKNVEAKGKTEQNVRKCPSPSMIDVDSDHILPPVVDKDHILPPVNGSDFVTANESSNPPKYFGTSAWKPFSMPRMQVRPEMTYQNPKCVSPPVHSFSPRKSKITEAHKPHASHSTRRSLPKHKTKHKDPDVQPLKISIVPKTGGDKDIRVNIIPSSTSKVPCNIEIKDMSSGSSKQEKGKKHHTKSKTKRYQEPDKHKSKDKKSLKSGKKGVSRKKEKDGKR